MGRRTGTDLVVVHRDRVLVVNRRTARTGGRSSVSSGTVTTLRDRSELIAVQRQLGATRNATDTLRAQTHEFDNQLHVISGLLQLAGVRRGPRLCGGADPAPSGDRLCRHGPDRGPAVGGTAGRQVLAWRPNRGCSWRSPRRLDARGCHPDLSTDVATVVGNLVDNALDAVANSAQASITVEVTADESAVTVVVSDTGPGRLAGLGGADLRSWIQHQVRRGGRRARDRPLPGPPDLRGTRRGGRGAGCRRRGVHRGPAGAARPRPSRWPPNDAGNGAPPVTANRGMRP